MIVSCDFKAIEWVVALELSKDKVGIKEWLEGVDMHAINQEKFQLRDRVTAKKFLFRLIYGGTEWSYAKDPDFNWISDKPKFWQEMIESFYTKYAGLRYWHERQVAEAMKSGYLLIPTGRRYNYVPTVRNGEKVWPRTTILNYPVQGFAAELVKIGRVLLRMRLKREVPNALIINSIHDSLVVDVEKEYTKAVLKIMWEIIHEQVLTTFNKLFTYKLSLPIRGELFYGPNQSNLEEWKPV